MPMVEDAMTVGTRGYATDLDSAGTFDPSAGDASLTLDRIDAPLFMLIVVDV